jgi:hypothetical protein
MVLGSRHLTPEAPTSLLRLKGFEIYSARETKGPGSWFERAAMAVAPNFLVLIKHRESASPRRCSTGHAALSRIESPACRNCAGRKWRRRKSRNRDPVSRPPPKLLKPKTREPLAKSARQHPHPSTRARPKTPKDSVEVELSSHPLPDQIPFRVQPMLATCARAIPEAWLGV